jgi:Domain of unknown function (DUF4384)
MLLPLLIALQQAPAPPPASRPVRVWLGSAGLLTRGTPVRVYVRAAQDGNLIVLHRRTDGRIEVLFPASPKDDPYVRAGTYEIQATASRVAFVVAEPDGSGLVLAALAPAGYRFDEFVREAAWNPDALAPGWDGSDGEGVLSDIVQRMLGDGHFNYDIATYSVAPPVYAMQQDSSAPPEAPAPNSMYPTCTDCTFIGYQENIFEPLALCDAFFSPCVGAPFHHFGRSTGAAAPATTSTIALTVRGSSGRPLIPQNGRASGGFVRRPTASATPPPEPRGRGPAATPVPLGPGRPAIAHAAAPRDVPARRRVMGAVTEAPAPQTVRLTLSPTARDDPEPARATSSVVLTGLTVTRTGLVPRARPGLAPSEAAAVEPAPRSRALAVAGGAGGGGGGGGGGSSAGGGAVVSQAHTIALPPAVFQGAQARGAVARVGVRRR